MRRVTPRELYTIMSNGIKIIPLFCGFYLMQKYNPYELKRKVYSGENPIRNTLKKFIFILAKIE